MVAGNDREELVLEELVESHSIHLAVKLVDDRDVDAAGEERVDVGAVIERFDRHLGCRLEAVERSEHGWEPLVVGRALRPDAHGFETARSDVADLAYRVS